MSTWEERMAVGAAGRVFIPPLDDTCEIGDPDAIPGHYGHHTHVDGAMFICSCGVGFGCFSFIPDRRYWSDDPAEAEGARREDEDYRAWIRCSLCGKRGVVAEQDWGNPWSGLG